MFKYADKLVMKENKDIIEIVGVSPAGQPIRTESSDKNYLVTIYGHKLYLPEELMVKMFELYKPEIKPEVKTITEIIEEIIPQDKAIKTRKRKQKVG